MKEKYHSTPHNYSFESWASSNLTLICICINKGAKRAHKIYIKKVKIPLLCEEVGSNLRKDDSCDRAFGYLQELFINAVTRSYLGDEPGEDRGEGEDDLRGLCLNPLT